MACGCRKGVMVGGVRYEVIYEVVAPGQEPAQFKAIGEAQAQRAQWGGGSIRSLRVAVPAA